MYVHMNLLVDHTFITNSMGVIDFKLNTLNVIKKWFMGAAVAVGGSSGPHNCKE